MSNQDCHSLPCKMDFAGRAPVSSFFRPTDVVNNDGTNNYQAATLRGRGLLAGPSLQVNGVVASTQSNNSVKVQERFTRYTEWKHTHQPETVLSATPLESRIGAAREWMQMAAVLHAPIPVKDCKRGNDATN